MKLFPIFLSLIFLVSCSSTGVVPMTQDSYYIGKKDGAPGLGVSFKNKAEVYAEANSFCSEKGKEVMILREDVKPAIPGRLGSTELHFKCVEPGGTANPLVKDSDTVIEIKNNR